MIKLTDKLEVSDDVVSREVGGEVVLLNLASGTYFGLNDVGSRFWDLAEEKPGTLADLCDLLEGEFDVARDQLEADVLALAEQLQGNELVSLAQA